MRITKLVGERIKEVPADAQVKSQILLIRAGFIKQVSNGIYTLLPPAQRVSKKIQEIIREEMDALDGQEVLFPVVMPKEMWEKSGRYYSIGEEMVRFKDRAGRDMLLGMTHEEAAVSTCQNIIKSYDQLPFMVYQIQTKFRDEARPRAGLIRVKEFTMKDAYSFHTTDEDLEEYYNKVFDGYNKIFKRVGMKNFISVKSDTGMMGGKYAHEFMLLTDIGEDSIVICDHCGYKANMEVATAKDDKITFTDAPLKEVFTGKAKSIEEVCEFLKIKKEQTIKAVCYCIVGDNVHTVIAFVRGDKDVNEAKLKRILGKDIAVKDLDGSGLVKGNIGLVGLDNEEFITIFDSSLEGATGMVTGANKEDYHITGVNISRDTKADKFYDFSKVSEGQKCSICGHELSIKRGIEIGNIFQLGTKYTKSMGMTVAMPDGSQINPIMGCYGIGVGRCLASVAEELADEKGLVWPKAIAPWLIYLCPLRNDDAVVNEKAEELYSSLSKKYEVLYDDRKVSAGVKLTDSELMGIPVRIVISPRSLAQNQVEVSIRQTGEKIMLEIDNLENELEKVISNLE
jgi:prolyl-tRNA synthetase